MTYSMCKSSLHKQNQWNFLEFLLLRWFSYSCSTFLMCIMLCAKLCIYQNQLWQSVCRQRRKIDKILYCLLNLLFPNPNRHLSVGKGGSSTYSQVIGFAMKRTLLLSSNLSHNKSKSLTELITKWWWPSDEWEGKPNRKSGWQASSATAYPILSWWTIAMHGLGIYDVANSPPFIRSRHNLQTHLHITIHSFKAIGIKS